jgi:hypothetical protein
MAVVDNAPDISVAICAELLTNVLVVVPASSAVVLVEKEAEGNTKAPDISVEICAELEIKVPDNSFSAVVNLEDMLELVITL